jgi:hypothetical protein
MMAAPGYGGKRGKGMFNVFYAEYAAVMPKFIEENEFTTPDGGRTITLVWKGKERDQTRLSLRGDVFGDERVPADTATGTVTGIAFSFYPYGAGGHESLGSIHPASVR